MRRFLAFHLAILAGVIPTAASFADEFIPAKRLPAGAIAYLEAARLSETIERIESSELWDTLRSGPAWEIATQTRQYKRFESGRAFLEIQFGTDLLTAAKGIFGKRTAIAVYPREGREQPDAVVLLQAADAELLGRIRERVEALLRLFFPSALENAEDVGAVKVIPVLADRLYYFVDGDVLAAGSRHDLLVAAARLAGDFDEPCLCDDAGFSRTVPTDADDVLLRGYVDSGAIAAAANVSEFSRKQENVLGSLLAAGVIELAVRSESVGFELNYGESKLWLSIRLGAVPETLPGVFRGFFHFGEEPGPVAIPRGPKILGGFSLYRDFKAFYQNREELIRDESLPGFDKFETGLANVLPGKDFAEDVLSTLGNRLTIVAARQDYDYLDGEPGVKLPGIALIVDLSKPRQGADLFQLLFQTIVGISNLQAGMQGRQPMILAAESYNDVQIQYGRLLSKPAGDQLPIGFNFTPASALVGDRFIMSSSWELCRTLVDYLKNPLQLSSRHNFSIELFPSAIADAVESNRRLLVARRIQEGRSPEIAEQELSLALKLMRRLDSIRLTQEEESDAFELRLEVDWQ